MRVIIAGSREFHNYRLLCEQCDKILFPYDNPIDIISGGAKGADQLGEWYAQDRDLALKIFQADWNGIGKSAGFRRNEEMAIYAKEHDGMLIAFWNGESRGTKHMIDTAKRMGLTVHVVRF